MNSLPDDMPHDVDDAPDEIVGEFVDVEMYEIDRQNRYWLRSCATFIEMTCKANKASLDGRTLTAINESIVAACDRASRIFHSDRTPIDEDDART